MTVCDKNKHRDKSSLNLKIRLVIIFWVHLLKTQSQGNKIQDYELFINCSESAKSNSYQG